MPTAPQRLAAPKAVLSTLNYSIPTGRRPRIDNDDYKRNDVPTEPVEVSISDGGTLPNLSLEVEGLACVAHEYDITGLPDSPEAGQRYRAEMERFMLEVTGADEVAVSNFPVARRQAQFSSGNPLSAPPADFVHCDFSPAGAKKCETTAYSKAPRDNARRVAHFNVWRLLSEGPTNRPLALCDATSLSQDDLILGDSVFNSSIDAGASFETVLVRHNPAHRWIYFPNLTHNQVLVFKQADTDPSGHPQRVAHTAFDDTTCTPAAMRISLETRCVATWNS